MTFPLPVLTDFLRIPSVSSEPEFSGQCDQARDFLVELFASFGFSTQILPSISHPAIFAQSPVSNPNLPTALIYGHYDVQPPGAPSLWTTPAFEPTVRKGRIYARGASDNKGQIFIHLMAVKQLIDQFGLQNLPVNFKFIIEGEEEIGSPGVNSLVQKYPHLVKADYIFLSDTEMVAAGHPSIDVSLRGEVSVDVQLQTGSQDVHSGQFGGLAPNSAFILIRMLSTLKNGDGKITLPGFYQNVVPLSPKEIRDFRHVEPKVADILSDGRLLFLGSSTQGLSINQRRWSEPTMDITGLDSGYTGSGSKTIIPNVATAKISFRLVPNQDPNRIYRLLVNYIQKMAPKRATLRFFRHNPAPAYKAPTTHPIYELTRKVLGDTFDHPAVFTGQGGSIGFVPVLARALNAPAVLIGFGLPDDNCHAPNEFLPLENIEKGIAAMVKLYSNIDKLAKPNYNIS